MENQKIDCGPGTVTHACSPSTFGGRGEQTASVQEVKAGETDSPAWVCLKAKISCSCWHVPVVPAPQEAEAGGLLEPERLRLQ